MAEFGINNPREMSERPMRAYMDRLSKAFNCPTFKVHRNGSTQSVTASTLTKIQFNSTASTEPTKQGWDSHSAFSLTTYRFSPLQPGYYMIGASLYFSVWTGVGDYILMMVKNGAASPLAQTQVTISSGGSPILSAQSLIYMGATDYMEFYATKTTLFSATISGDPSLTHAWGFRIPG